MGTELGDFKILDEKGRSQRYEENGTISYLGWAEIMNAENNQPVWYIKRIVHSGANFMVDYASQGYDQVWDDKASLKFANLSTIYIDSLEAAETATVGDPIATISSNGGKPSVVYTIDSDPDSKFQIVGNELRLLNTVSSPDTHNLTIKAVDGDAVELTQAFVITAVTQLTGATGVLTIPLYDRIEKAEGTTTTTITYKLNEAIVMVATINYTNTNKNDVLTVVYT